MRILPLLLCLTACGSKAVDEDDTHDDAVADDTGATPDCVDREAYVGFLDGDGDGFGRRNTRLAQCDPLPEGYAPNWGDCDDNDESRYPGADEYCNGKDDDCDGVTDNDPVDPRTFYRDNDLDGYGTTTSAIKDCNNVDGYVPYDGDCNDENAEQNPGLGESCDDLDNDCDGEVDEEAVDAPSWFPDADGDGHGDMFSIIVACEGPEGAVSEATDCDDSDISVYVDAPELCDGINNDCDGYLDEGCPTDTGDTGGLSE